MSHTIVSIDGVFDTEAALQGGRPTVENVARKVAMSRRTLHRRLAGEGTAFADLRDSLRKELRRSI